ncbi:MAG: DoxX family protein [Bacteroidales bacterium]|jgi:uncharacterized membrane protein YphA (DoxX/SURF4 family)|nr:DoxX family protein [Bacteroidales bacterium]
MKNLQTKNYIQFGIGLLLIFATLTTLAFFDAFEDASWTKLWVLLATIVSAAVGLTLIFEQRAYAISISRFFTGILFIFSGFVKAVDPLGSKYKFIDYFEAWNVDFLAPAALTLGIIMSTAELLIGLCLVFKIYPKLSSLGALIFMIGFTPVTLYLAMQQNITGKELVHDCGCFGDALVLTNWQTFVKNVFILVPVVFLFFYRKKIQPSLTPVFSLIATIILTLSIVAFSVYALCNLPPIDFRPYKIGTHLISEQCEEQAIARNVKTYQYAQFVNNQTGERKEFEITENYPDWEIWEIDTEKPIREEKEKLQNVAKQQFTRQTFELPPMFAYKGGTDYTCDIIKDTSFVFLLVQYDVKTSKTGNAPAINELYEWTQAHNFVFYALTASLDEDVEAFRTKTNARYEFLNADDIALKTIVRANPGLVLLKNGVVINNWNGNDIPSIAEFEKIVN